ncbi:G protein-activated inward rectifier potassium channel 3-like isoform X2 [Cylas formicarius]|uniref:G protein-activated inward rectifier potassium channel 3-like isoform X2 n=1 Tax=Cylas formicarius TaxID=197179 RepID=UPI0029586E47|nr:G protein-activated inward rectifier potassium channel 3-like isoform X2 [Cylas formicarius]
MAGNATTPSRQKLPFFPPKTIKEHDEDVDAIYDKPKFKIGGDSPLISRRSNGESAIAKGPNIDQFPAGAMASLNRIGTDVSLARISTWNSSLYGGLQRQGSSRRSFRPNATRKMRRRAVFKNGDCNILQSRISKRRLRYLQDIFTTLVDSQWRWTLTIFSIGFLGSWLLFALIWWLIAFTHGDLDESHLPMMQAETNWTPCVLNIQGFTSCFLFSIETQHTIGYGVRTTTEECPEAIFVMCLQSIAGMIIQAFMVGIVFAKMTRPKLRTQTLQFSKNALICQRDGHFCLMFRVGDMRKSHIIGASIRAQLIRAKKTKEGEILSNFQTELPVHADGCDGNLFFIWPMTIVHKINEESPFYYLSASDMLQERFEIVVILEGTIESTGQTTQARSSYLASEVLWGHRFESVVSYNKDRQGFEVNYSKFDNTLAVDTPLCSGADLAEFYRIRDLPDNTEFVAANEVSAPPI